MALNIDTSTPLRGVSDLIRLVEAIHRAAPNDESRAIEWKSTLDLGSKHGCFHVARAILGFANRMPDAAAMEFNGLGYILVGVEPGNVAGITSIDNARLYSQIVPYVGEDGPRWTAVEVPYDDNVVLVVTVEAPRPGDPIHVLCKEGPPNGAGKTAPEGTVFVRRPGETARANKQEMDLLQQRLLDRRHAAPAVAVEPSAEDDEPLDWYDPDGLDDEIARWVAECADVERRAAERTDKRLHPERYPQPTAPASILDVQRSGVIPHLAALDNINKLAASMSVANLMSEPDERTLEEYLEGLDAWTEELTESATGSFENRFVHACRTLVWFKVSNRSDRNLENVHVRVTFDWPALRGLDEWERCRALPLPPRGYGEPRSLTPHIGAGFHLPSLDALHIDPLPRSTWIEEGSVVAAFDLGHVYPHDSGTSEALAFIVTERPPDGVLSGRWEVRASNVDAVARGVLKVPVNEDPADPADVLDYGLTDDE